MKLGIRPGLGFFANQMSRPAQALSAGVKQECALLDKRGFSEALPSAKCFTRRIRSLTRQFRRKTISKLAALHRVDAQKGTHALSSQ